MIISPQGCRDGLVTPIACKIDYKGHPIFEILSRRKSRKKKQIGLTSSFQLRQYLTPTAWELIVISAPSGKFSTPITDFTNPAPIQNSPEQFRKIVRRSSKVNKKKFARIMRHNFLLLFRYYWQLFQFI